MTSRIAPLGSNIGHWRFRYSESEKQNTGVVSWEVPIFAYLRKSTNKKEQEDSLVQQEDGISSIVKKLRLEGQEIRYFAETFSWFENKKRKEWGKMLEQIDKLKTPCIILCRDISRLSRNPTDSQKIMDRVYWDNHFKKNIKIAQIYSLDYDKIKEWDINTDKEDMHKALSASYYDSLDTRRKSIGGILLKLENGEFPYHAPRGLEHIVLRGKKVLKQNDKMPFVRHAFEMKVARRGHKEIVKYLKQYGGIKISYKELTERYFVNTVYIGKYTEKTTGQEFGELQFAEGKPPISLALWDKVQTCLSKRGRIYRDASERDIFEERGHIEGGGLLARYDKKKVTKAWKKTYTYYKNTKAKVNIVQDNILKAFLGEMEKVIFLWWTPYIYDFLCCKEVMYKKMQTMKSHTPEDADKIKKLVKDAEIQLKQIEQEKANIQAGPAEYFEKYRDNPLSGLSVFSKEVARSTQKGALVLRERNALYATIRGNLEKHGLTKSSLYSMVSKEFREGDLEKEIWQRKERLKDSDVHIQGIFSSSPFFREGAEMKRIRKQEVSRLELEKKILEEERKNYRRKAVNLGYSAQEIEETSNDMEKSIKLIQEQINEFSGSSDMEELLERLPQILSEIVELAQKSLGEEEITEKKDSLKKLFEITVSNFSVSIKKELQIKLFDVLDVLVNGGKVNMEAPAGVEPASRALQAPVWPFYQGAK